MTNRRTFLLTCGGVVAAPALAKLLLPPAPVALPAIRPAAPATVAFKIAGWEPHIDNDTAVWIQVSSSWRATWR